MSTLRSIDQIYADAIMHRDKLREAEEAKKFIWRKFFFTLFSVPFIAIPACVLMLPLDMLNAWARSVIWNLFAVPILHLPHLTMWPMLGLGLVIDSLQSNFMKNEVDDPNEGKTEGLVRVCSRAIWTNVISLAMAVLIYHFFHGRIVGQ